MVCVVGGEVGLTLQDHHIHAEATPFHMQHYRPSQLSNTPTTKPPYLIVYTISSSIPVFSKLFSDVLLARKVAVLASLEMHFHVSGLGVCWRGVNGRTTLMLNHHYAKNITYTILTNICSSSLFEVLQGLEYLSLAGINCCYNICPSNILVDPFGRSKLYNYGLYYMTEFGAAVSFPIG